MKNTKTWSIGKRVAGTCVVLVLLGVAVGTVSLVTTRRLRGQLTGVARESLRRCSSSPACRRWVSNIAARACCSERPVLAQKSQLQHLAELEKQMKTQLEQIRAGVPEAEMDRFNALEYATRNLVTAITHFRELSAEGKSQEAGAFWSESGGSKSKAFRKALEDMVQLEQQHATATVAAGLSTASGEQRSAGHSWL